MSKNTKLALLFNVAIVVCEVLALVQYGFDVNQFHYYTVDSNLLTLVASLIYAICILVKKDNQEVPYFSTLLRYISTACLTLTFIVVILVLPFFGGVGESTGLDISNYGSNLVMYLTHNNFLYHHLLCPVLSIVSFCIFEGDRRLNKKKTIWLALLPTAIYAIVLIVLNIINEISGPYPFLRVNEQPIYMSIIWFVVIFGINYLLARVLLVENQKHSPRRKKKDAK